MKYRQHGLMWWRSQLMAFILRPLPGTVKAVSLI